MEEHNNSKVSQAVIPVAGMGTRMLPFTKEISKEFIPILNKPLIHFIIEEVVSAGINEIIFVTRKDSKEIKNYFKKNLRLENFLIKNHKKNLIKDLPNEKFKKIKFFYVAQPKPLGLGHAILKTEKLIKKDAFAVFLPDEFLIQKNHKSDFQQMIENYDSNNMGQILVEEVHKTLLPQYGVVKLKKKATKFKPEVIQGIVEKPSIKLAPSNKRVVGRYILPRQIFKNLKEIQPGKNKELQLTDAIKKNLIDNTNSFQATVSNSDIFDCGSVKGLLGANIALGLLEDSKNNNLKIIQNSPGGGIGRHKGLKIPR